MSVEIEGLEFQVEAKSDKGADGIDKLANSFKNLKSAIKSGTNLDGSIKQLEKLNQALSGLHTDKLESLGKAMESLNKAGNIKIPASVPKRISEIGNAMKSISQSDIDRMESMSRALQGMQGLQNVRVPQVNTGGTGSGTPNPADINTEPASSGRSTSHSGTQTEDVSNTGGADNGMSHADSQLQEVTRSAGMARTALSGVKKVIGEIGGLTGISYVGQQIGSLPHKIGQALGSLRTMYSEFKKSGGILGAFGRTIKAVATNLGSKLAAGMKQVTSSLGNAFTSKVHNATSALGSFLSSIKRIALYRMIRFAMSQLTQCFKDGINNLYNYSALMGGTFANSMNSLATNAQYLKNSMGAMAAPLINALAPAIDFVIGKVVALFNILNQLFARLTGSKTYTAAKKVAATYGGAAKDAAGTASKAAKKAADEIKRYTLGFDELNILGDKNKDSSGSGGGGGGGGGASTPDYGSMFEELPIDNSISEFADKLKEAFEAGDWKELGTILGNKFNEIVDSIDWAGFGKKVGYGINGAVQTAYWFLKTADFKNLGNHVAEFLNSALSEIDFTFVGRLLVRGFTAGLDFLRGALGGLNWGIEGTNWNMEDGKHVPNDDLIEGFQTDFDKTQLDTGVRKWTWFVKNGNGTDGTPYDVTQYKVKETRQVAMNHFGENDRWDTAEFAGLTPAGSTPDGLKWQKIQDIYDQEYPKIVNADSHDAAMEEYDKMISEMNDAGLEDVEKVITQNYQERMKLWNE